MPLHLRRQPEGGRDRGCKQGLTKHSRRRAQAERTRQKAHARTYTKQHRSTNAQIQQHERTDTHT
eukprot:4999702-Pleurochrysis_carterae.AAC.1